MPIYAAFGTGPDSCRHAISSGRVPISSGRVPMASRSASRSAPCRHRAGTCFSRDASRSASCRHRAGTRFSRDASRPGWRGSRCERLRPWSGEPLTDFKKYQNRVFKTGLARGRTAGWPAGWVEIEIHTHLTNETRSNSMYRDYIRWRFRDTTQIEDLLKTSSVGQLGNLITYLLKYRLC